MLYEKIIQIMPAPENMVAIYENKNCEEKNEKVVCLALDSIGNIAPMVCGLDGYIDVAEASNFKGIRYL